MLLLVQKNRKKNSRIDSNSKTSKVFEQKFASLGLQNPLKIKIKLIGSIAQFLSPNFELLEVLIRGTSNKYL